VCVGNEKVGREHGASKFSTVATVTGERCYEARAFGGLGVGKRGLSATEMHEDKS
jgi:hypothetical protein